MINPCFTKVIKELPKDQRKALWEAIENRGGDKRAAMNVLDKRIKGLDVEQGRIEKAIGADFAVRQKEGTLPNAPIPLKPAEKPAKPKVDIENIQPETPEVSRAKAAEVSENKVNRDRQKSLYPILEESQTKNGKFLPATDDMLARFAKTDAETIAKLNSGEKGILRAEYNKERVKQNNAYKMDEQNRKDFGIEVDPELRKEINAPPPEVGDLSGSKDISRISIGWRDFDRNAQHSLSKTASDQLISLRDNAKSKNTEFLLTRDAEHTQAIHTELGIKPGSKADRAIQTFGEGDMTLEQLTKKFGNKKAGDIVKAAEWYRARYEEFIRQYNQVAAEIWPGDAGKLIRRKKHYFRHFRDLGDMSRLLEIVEDPGGIYGISEKVSPFIKAKGKIPGFVRRRLTSKTDISASAGYTDYLQQVGYAIHVNPMINMMRKFSVELGKATERSGQLPNFRRYLDRWIDRMAGVPDGGDAYIRSYFGKGYDLLNVINQRAKQNVIIGNLASVLAQPFNIPQAMAEMGPSFYAQGFAKTMAEMLIRSDLKGWRSSPMSQSPFMRERYLESMFSKYRFGMIKRTKDTAAWMLRTGDEIATKTIWNGFYSRATNKGIKNPITYADRMTRKMVAGRGIGELALAQKSKWFQMVGPFQIEVGNAMWAFRDLFKGERKFSKLATFTLASYMMNRMAEEVRGNPVSFDPLQAMIEGFNLAVDDRATAQEKALGIPGRLAGELLSNIPVGQTVAALYPEHGFDIPLTDVKMPTRRKVFGTNDPTRFGSTVLAWDAIKEWPSRLLLPFGGVQAKKTIGGAKAIVEGEMTFGKKTIDIEPTKENIAKALMFGKYTTKEFKEYIKEEHPSRKKERDNIMQWFKDGETEKARKYLKMWNDSHPKESDKIDIDYLFKYLEKKD